MKNLRTIAQFSLNEIDGVTRMYNTILTDNTLSHGVSYPLDAKHIQTLQLANADDFVARAKQLCGNDINSVIAVDSIYLKKRNNLKYIILDKSIDSITITELCYLNPRIYPMARFFEEFQRETKL